MPTPKLSTSDRNAKKFADLFAPVSLEPDLTPLPYLANPDKAVPSATKPPAKIGKFPGSGRPKAPRLKPSSKLPDLSADAAKALVKEDQAAKFGPPPKAVQYAEYRRQQKELELLERANLDELRELGRKEFWLFMTEILFPLPHQRQHYHPQIHAQICQELQDLKRGENFLCLLPRAHRKTFTVLAYLAWLIVRDPNIRIRLVSVRLDRAKKLATLLRKIFSYDVGQREFAKFQKVYPEMVIKGRIELLQAQQFTHPLRTAAHIDPTVYSTFLEGSGTGGRADVIVFDDAWDAKSLPHADAGQKVLGHFLETLPLRDSSALSQYGNIIITATPWKHFDPSAVILGLNTEELMIEDAARKVLEEAGQFKVMVRHAKEISNKPCEVCPPRVTHRYPHGHPDWDLGEPILFPIWDNASLEREKNLTLLAPGQGEVFFAMQYQVLYRVDAASRFKRDWFLSMPTPDWAAPQRRALVLDTANKDFRQPGRGDYMVAHFVSYDELARVCFVHGFRSNLWTKDDFINRIVGWCQAANWWPEIIGKEKFGLDSSFLTDLANFFRLKCGKFVHIEVISRPPGQEAKNDFIVESSQAPFQRGEVFFGSIYPPELKERMIEEYTQLGSVLHEDTADAATLAFQPKIRPTPLGSYRAALTTVWEPPPIALYNPDAPASGNEDVFQQFAFSDHPTDKVLLDLQDLYATIDFQRVPARSSSPVVNPTGWDVD